MHSVASSEKMGEFRVTDYCHKINVTLRILEKYFWLATSLGLQMGNDTVYGFLSEIFSTLSNSDKII